MTVLVVISQGEIKTNVDNVANVFYGLIGGLGGYHMLVKCQALLFLYGLSRWVKMPPDTPAA